MQASKLRVVLVRTQVPGNIGSVARVMRNFGLEELVLVAPEANPLDPEARKLSTHGESILHAARHVESLDQALAGCLSAAATSARTGERIRGSLASPRAVLPKLTSLLVNGHAALVFGPERDGLRDDELASCPLHVHIATSPSYAALNLAQAVAICLYECSLHSSLPEQAAPEVDLPDLSARERLFGQLRDGLRAIHFLYDAREDAQMHAIRQIIERASITERESKILMGLARQMKWVGDQLANR